MNEKFNKNAKVEKLTNMFLSSGEEKGLIVKAPYQCTNKVFLSHPQACLIVSLKNCIFVYRCSWERLALFFDIYQREENPEHVPAGRVSHRDARDPLPQHVLGDTRTHASLEFQHYR